MIELDVKHHFFPVGQGLFAYGELTAQNNPRPIPERRHISLGEEKSTRFRWVYDCGTHSGRALLTRQIARLKVHVGAARLDLLTLSHLHNDHVSGVVELLNEVKARTVMLPWAPLWHRLLIGFDQGLDGTDAAFQFYVDPVGYLAEAAPDRFDEIVFVLPSDGEGPPPATEVPPSFEPLGPFGESLKDKEDCDKFELPRDTLARGRTITVSGLAPGRSLAVYGVWEFVPYNDPTTAPAVPHQFLIEVEAARDQLLHGDEEEREQALHELKETYRRQFGRKSQNDVSLMLFGAPVGHWSYRAGWYGIPFRRWPPHVWQGVDLCSASILFTGDGNFSSPPAWLRIESYLGNPRLNDLGIFQVPHHGSRKNWHDGLANAVSARVNVICSHPTGSYGHPHAEVLRDFWSFGVIQVDKLEGSDFEVLLSRP